MTPMSLRPTCLLCCRGYTRQSAQAELERVFNAQYQLTLTEEGEVRYRTGNPDGQREGNSYTVEVPYNYYIFECNAYQQTHFLRCHGAF